MAKMMKAMKAMKAMKKSMKMKKAAKRVSKIARGKYARASVFRGNKAKTQSGLAKGDLKKNKKGKIVSKKASAAGHKKFKQIQRWTSAFKAARKALGVRGFCPCGGKTAQGRALLAKTRSLYKK